MRCAHRLFISWFGGKPGHAGSGRPRADRRRRRLDFDAVEARTLLSGGMTAGHRPAAAHAATAGPSRAHGTVHAEATANSGVLNSQVIAALNAEITRQVRANNLPGVAVEITVPGSRPFVAIQGMANLATGQARSITDAFRIASVTKTFTATAVLQLVDKGLIRKTDALARWFPTFPNAQHITVDDLLRMRSGIPEVFDSSLAAQFYADPTWNISADQVMARAAARIDQFQPADAATVYTNTNYTILGAIVERVTGRPLGDQIAKTILQPLGLTHTYYATGTALVGPLRGYSFRSSTHQFVDKTALDPAVAGGAGAMVSTVGDLTAYVGALVQGKLLRPATQAARLAATPLAGGSPLVQYGEGIEKLGQFVGQNGTIFGFSTEMFSLPALKATIVINVNRLDSSDDSASTPLFLALSRIAFPRYVNW